jgi:hypothetical protein
VAAQRLVHDLPDQIRQTNAGHLHEQNAAGDIEHGNRIQLVEGSTGAGGLDNINRGGPTPPIEFSIESVSATCQFTKVVRFQLVGPPPDEGEVPTTGQQVIASTRYLDPQQLDKDRQCGVYQQLGAPSPLPG